MFRERLPTCGARAPQDVRDLAKPEHTVFARASSSDAGPGVLSDICPRSTACRQSALAHDSLSARAYGTVRPARLDASPARSWLLGPRRPYAACSLSRLDCLPDDITSRRAGLAWYATPTPPWRMHRDFASRPCCRHPALVARPRTSELTIVISVHIWCVSRDRGVQISSQGTLPPRLYGTGRQFLRRPRLTRASGKPSQPFPGP
jgi:hypothetical protein